MKMIRTAVIVLGALLLTATFGHAKRPPARSGVRLSEVKKPRPAAAGAKATPDKTPAEKSVVNKDRGSDAETSDSGTTTSTSGKTLKTKTYNFSAMDVEGRLKTPQLLYFLDRVKLELDMSAPDKRSFMKELEKSADDGAL